MNLRMRWVLIGSLGVLGLLTASGVALAVRPWGSSPLRVGTRSFSDADIALRERVIAFKFGASESARLGAYTQLIQGALLAEVLAASGHPVTPAQVSEELQRINTSTRDPQGLAELKRICGGEETRGYREIAILPDFVNRRWFYEVFPNLEEIHRPRLNEAKARLAELRSGMTPDKLGGLWQRQDLIFSAKHGFRAVGEKRPGATEAAAGAGGEGAKLERELFAVTPKGVWTELLPLGTGLVLLRWTGWADEGAGERRVEQCRLPKRDAHEVYFERARSIPVSVGDVALREELKRKVSWAREVRWEE